MMIKPSVSYNPNTNKLTQPKGFVRKTNPSKPPVPLKKGAPVRPMPLKKGTPSKTITPRPKAPAIPSISYNPNTNKLTKGVPVKQTKTVVKPMPLKRGVSK